MHISKKTILCIIIAFVLVLGLMSATAFANGSDQVYISVSYDGKYITDKNNGYIANIPVSFDALSAIDLDDYNLGEYWYDEDGDGTYEITALQLVIYVHENIFGGDWSDVRISGAPGSSYFEGGIFGFDENLQYYLNGKYPLARDGWGATSDQIVLEAGDILDIASFSSWDFYQDSAYGFHYFADGNNDITHSYNAEAGTACNVKLIKGTKDAEYNSIFVDTANYEIFYGTSLYDTAGSVTTDDSGQASITFPSAGTWYLWADGGYGTEFPEAIVSAPGFAKVTVSEKAENNDPDDPREAQDVSIVLDATMAKMVSVVTAPEFGTTAGEWTVLSLARGDYYAKDNAYFTDYYSRIIETVNTEAAAVNMNGALHKNKSTENSRLIVALSSIGIDATSVGNWNLITPYNDFNWIKKQGLNGPIWALIALDSNNYSTTDTTIRQQCIDAILAAQHNDGGWALTANLTYASDPDITGMALTALYPYRNQPEVAAACAKAFEWLSEEQHDNGIFASGGSECSESCAWVIIACTTWGINPDTDSRFIKNNNSVVDGLLAHYVEEEAMFQHIIGAGTNAMGTDQGCYGLVAYDRFINGKTSLYDFRDVTFETAPISAEMTATLGLPEKINAGDTFNGIISINKWDNEAGYKLIDLIVNIPEGLTVTGVTASNRLSGGNISYHLENESGKLRIVYFDANENSDLTISGDNFPAELFTIEFKANNVTTGSKLNIAISNMSVKLSSDSSDKNSMIIVNTSNANGIVDVVAGISFSAVCLYEGDDIDLIPSTKKAVAVAVTGIADGVKMTYNDGTNEMEFKYSTEISEKSGVATYVAIVDSTINMANFINQSYFVITNDEAAAITFGDSNGDVVINAQDALAIVDTWLRKGDAPTDDQILILNVNGDSRINTFDALGIVENFVNGSEYGVVTKAATITTNQ